MRHPILVFFLVILGASRLVSCSGDKEVSVIGPHAPVRPMPAEAVDTVDITFTDVHCWTEKGYFNVVGLANNTDYKWHQLWVQITAVDADSRALSINGQPTLVVPVMSDAVPPRGRSSFFANIPLEIINGTPEDCRVQPAGVTTVEPGPILIPTEQSGVKMMVHGETGAEPKETGWIMRVTINNPLPVPANRPCLEALLYGNDGKLWYAQVLDPIADTVGIQQDVKGPIAPQGSKTVGFNIMYKGLPKGLQDSLIRNVEIQCFEKRMPVAPSTE